MARLTLDLPQGLISELESCTEKSGKSYSGSVAVREMRA